jgi:hypothetical protein
MLANPGMGPNATINRWIEKILMFHFKLKHVPGERFAPDGLMGCLGEILTQGTKSSQTRKKDTIRTFLQKTMRT